MASETPTREQALALLREYNHSETAQKHALAVEAVMRHFARRFGEDPDRWGVVGLVHDVDYERFPEQHCRKAPEILAAAGWPEELIRAVVSHGWGICSEVEPQSRMEKVLYAVDELTGLVAAAALVRPSRSLTDLTAKSVSKKWKDKRFAAGVDRQVIEKGAAMLEMELSELITEVIAGMREVAGAIGLGGAAAPEGSSQ
ncbi:MAG: hydrolase [Phycisphaerae bacterium SM23_33]|jgi:predicted hydrolase (HD superfamily)|nr:MAG: hydrolase [Phycisphaerae bacterium SM23_33]